MPWGSFFTGYYTDARRQVSLIQLYHQYFRYTEALRVFCTTPLARLEAKERLAKDHSEPHGMSASQRTTPTLLALRRLKVLRVID